MGAWVLINGIWYKTLAAQVDTAFTDELADILELKLDDYVGAVRPTRPQAGPFRIKN